MILTADIGGTNARFALVEKPDGAAARIALQRSYGTATCPGFGAALDAFAGEIARSGWTRPVRAVIAIAGPVDEDGGELTNRRSWGVGREALRERGIDGVFINDFEALAYGVAHIAPGDFTVLQDAVPVPHANIALVGAGTGLGVGALVWNGERYRASPSEGGHIGFAPQSEAQLGLWRHLNAKYGRVSAERVVSGPGLEEIHRWLSGEPDTPVAAEIAAQDSRALDIFVSCYGAVAGDIALAFLARGGVYVCGGIAAKLAERLARPDFIAAFRDKGRHSGLMASMPVRVVLNENLGLLGAACAPFPGM